MSPPPCPALPPRPHLTPSPEMLIRPCASGHAAPPSAAAHSDAAAARSTTSSRSPRSPSCLLLLPSSIFICGQMVDCMSLPKKGLLFVQRDGLGSRSTALELKQGAKGVEGNTTMMKTPRHVRALCDTGVCLTPGELSATSAALWSNEKQDS
ncbi:unnamed protein product [Pleuronectes platessa]|uniref:Uncharacterized protein n=1 Tax=Pleuronectes platessa TaxID=8262 RepID=A0A9N7UGS8_PLEPL|nr:unnamed protein product [Pleuronectes platessa]